MSAGGNRIRLGILEIRYQHGDCPRSDDAIDQFLPMLLIEAAIKDPIQEQNAPRVQMSGKLILVGHHHQIRFRNSSIHRAPKHP